MYTLSILRHVCVYVLLNIYIERLVWKSLFDYRHPSPRHEWKRLEAAALAPLLVDTGLPGLPRVSFASHFLCAGITNAPNTARSWCSFWPKVIPSSTWKPKVAQGRPPASQEGKGEPKVSPSRAPCEPKAPQRKGHKRKPKVAPRRAKWAQKEDTQRRKTNQENYIHTPKHHTSKLPIYRHTTTA